MRNIQALKSEQQENKTIIDLYYVFRVDFRIDPYYSNQEFSYIIHTHPVKEENKIKIIISSDLRSHVSSFSIGI